MLKKIIIASSGLGAILALAIMHLSTPATIHPVGLLVFFVCVYAVSLGAIVLTMYLAQRVYAKINSRSGENIDQIAIYEYASVVALGPVILLALQTVGRLQTTDVIFTALFISLGCFYVSKRR